MATAASIHHLSKNVAGEKSESILCELFQSTRRELSAYMSGEVRSGGTFAARGSRRWSYEAHL